MKIGFYGISVLGRKPQIVIARMDQHVDVAAVIARQLGDITQNVKAELLDVVDFGQHLLAGWYIQGLTNDWFDAPTCVKIFGSEGYPEYEQLP
jgi:hypothetical protein